MQPAAASPVGLSAATPVRRRDDFKPAVKAQLAQRVGYLCSNPQCRRLTIGPRMGEEGANNIGVAAHIRAAAVGGPRFDPDQTPAERGSRENGIWLCSDHAHLIDHDEKEFTAETLLSWKRRAEEYAFQQLASGRGNASVQPVLDELVAAVADLRAQLGVSAESSPTDMIARVRAGSRVQVEAFESSPRWPTHSVELDLTVEGVDGLVDQSRFGAILQSTQKIVLLSAPGTGKTTSLVQIARKMLDVGPAPVLVPLGEWAESGKSILASLLDRQGYGGLTIGHFQFLAHLGELALLLDGWNEVPPHARLRLIKELEQLEREFPLLNLVMSSRGSVDVPLQGRRVKVQPLSDDQQSAIASAMRGAAGLDVLDAAWRTNGLNELVTIPLYLRALMEVASGGKLPETKEQVLRGMVEAHEADPYNKEIFHRELESLHRTYLVSIAAAAQADGGTTQPEAVTRDAITSTAQRLIETRQITEAPKTTTVIDVLVGSHLLVREAGEIFAFQHQQLQEWFASIDLEAGLRVAGDSLDMAHPLAIVSLNDRQWSEVVLFACERMSRADDEGAKVVAHVVQLLLGIDPLFAAEVIARSGPAVWDILGKTVQDFATRWGAHSRSDRAVSFMITSRRPEFADIVWPLVSTDKDQRAFHLVRRFNPAVLADRLAREYGGLTDGARETLVVNLAYQGDRDGIDAALALGLSEPDLKIRLRICEGFSYRGATRQLETLLQASGDEAMQQFAERYDLDSIRDPVMLADLTARHEALIFTGGTPVQRLARALRSLPDTEAALAALRELRDPAYSFKDQGSHLMYSAWSRFPAEVAAALQTRVEAGLELPFRPFEYLEAAQPTDSSSIAALALDSEGEERRSPAAYLAGPITVRELVGRYLHANRKYRADPQRSPDSHKETRMLEDRLESTRASVLFKVLEDYGVGLAADDISALSSVVSGHGAGADREELKLDATERIAAVRLMEGWGRQLLAMSASRHDLAQLTWAMRRLPHPSQASLLADMIEVDLTIVGEARARYDANNRDHTALDEFRTNHTLEYRVVLTMLGTREAEAILRAHLLDPVFWYEAAVGLQVIWQERNETKLDEKKGHQWPDFERAYANRARNRGDTCEIAEALIEAAEIMLKDQDVKSIGRAAHYLGRAALLPHGDRMPLFLQVLASNINGRIRKSLLQLMAVGGLVPPADELLRGLNEALGEIKGRWLHDNDLYQVFDWIELLPLSDRPLALLDGLDALTAAVDFGRWRIRDLLASLHHLDEKLRITLIRSLLDRDPDLTEQYDLFLALKAPGVTTLDLILDIASGKYGQRPIGRVTRYDFPETLFRTLTPEARAEVPARFALATNAAVKSLLGQILLAGADHGVFLDLVQDSVGRKIIGQFGWGMRSTILYLQEPSDAVASSYTLIPRDITELRGGLFRLTLSRDAEIARFAAETLERIDAEREEQGGVESPRHPAIDTLRPWPSVSLAGGAAN